MALSTAFLARAVAAAQARKEVTLDSEKARKLLTKREAAEAARIALLRATVCVHARALALVRGRALLARPPLPPPTQVRQGRDSSRVSVAGPADTLFAGGGGSGSARSPRGGAGSSGRRAAPAARVGGELVRVPRPPTPPNAWAVVDTLAAREEARDKAAREAAEAARREAYARCRAP